MDRTADNLMDLSQRDRSGQLRFAHRAATFFFVFEAAVDIGLGFLAEPDFSFVEADLLEEDFADVDLDDADFFDPDLVDGVLDLGDSGFELA
jgi:hypothetical protein